MIKHKIKELREAGFTQTEIAKRAGLAGSTISRILAGYTVLPGTEEKIMAVYDREFPAREISSLRRSLATANGNFDFAQDHIKSLQNELAREKEKSCVWCRVKAYFRSWYD